MNSYKGSHIKSHKGSHMNSHKGSHMQNRSTTDRRPKRPYLRLAEGMAAASVAILASACGFFASDEEAATVTTAAIVGPISTVGSPGNTVTTLIVTTTSTTSTVPPLSVDSRLSTGGLGSVRIGHTLAQTASEGGANLTLSAGGTDECQIYTQQGWPEDITFAVVNDDLVRIDINAGPVKSVSGYGIGSTGADIRNAFGDRIEDGPTASAIQFVPVDEADADKRVIWQLGANDIVTALRVGRVPYVLSLNPCVPA